MKNANLLITLFVSLLIFGCAHQAAPTDAITLSPSVDLVKTHMAILSADDMEGREAGTPGYNKAADYVAAEYKKLGLVPGGDAGSYFQDVPLRWSYRKATEVGLEVQADDGTTLDLEESAEYHVGGSLSEEQSEITADVVFVGFGLVAPELGRDDYAGVDVKGKVVAILSGTPSGIQSEERAFYGAQKAKEASDRGAVGVLSLYTPVREKIYAFDRLAKEGRMDTTRMSWIQKNGQVYSKAPNLKVSATFSMAGAAKLFEGSQQSWDQVVESAMAEGGKTTAFDLPLRVRIKQASNLGEASSANVIGVIPGSDPVLKKEVLVLSAHLDGIGISHTDEADKINNGALDNAAGVATLLETARMIMLRGAPRRTILFLANTAEEKGLLGAEYFALNPTLAGHKIVANINLDMPVLTYDFQDVVIFGGERSTLKSAIEAAAKQMDLSIGPDPFPEQGIFTRSDHFRFVEAGIPSVMLATGMANGGEAAWAEHFAKHYHRPSDDMQNNIDFSAAAKFAELKTRITLQVANADQRPLWHKGDFFARQFDGPMSAE